MRSTLPLLVISAWAAAAVAQAQTAVTPRAVEAQQTAGRGAARNRPTATPPAAAALPESRTATTARTARHSRGARSEPPGVRSATDVTRAGAPTAKRDGVLALGASDITGNKELPKVMVIVPWKSPTDAGGVVEPSDSVMNEVLGPVDRGVFQRRIRYYGQLNAARERPAAQPVAPVGDSR
jgi:hypothetical protein